MTIQLPVVRPTQPAPQCVKCEQPFRPGQHRVIHNQRVSLFANATPWFSQPYGTAEIRLRNGWFYVSLHTPLQPVIKSLQLGHLPWLCPQCAGYLGTGNLHAPEATVLTDNGEQRATGASTLMNQPSEVRDRVT